MAVHNFENAELNLVIVEENGIATAAFLSQADSDPSGGGGGGTPGGSDTQIQFNDSGAFGGNSALFFQKTNNNFQVGRSDYSVSGHGNFYNRDVRFPSLSAYFNNSSAGDWNYVLDLTAQFRTGGAGDTSAAALFISAEDNTDAPGGGGIIGIDIWMTESNNGTALLRGVWIQSPGVVHTVNNYGVSIDSQAGGSTRSAALHIADQGTGTKDFAIYVEGGKTSLDTATLKAYTFATLPTVAAGSIAYVTDSNTVTWGANIAGGSTNKVLAFYNGTNWTVFGK